MRLSVWTIRPISSMTTTFRVIPARPAKLVEDDQGGENRLAAPHACQSKQGVGNDDAALFLCPLARGAAIDTLGILLEEKLLLQLVARHPPAVIRHLGVSAGGVAGRAE